MSYANRGMGFENMIDETNEMYCNQELAVINKRPTPVKVTKSKNGKVLAGYFEKSSTVDYDGVYDGRAIMFEAKSIQELSRFDLSNLHDHQYEYLNKCHRAGAITFVLIDFKKQRKIYLLPFESLKSYVERAKNGGRKSIPLDDFDIYGYEVEQGRVPVDYLTAVRKVWFSKAV